MSQAKIREIIYQDIDMKLTQHPITNQVNFLKNDAAVKRSVKNLIFTRRYEIFYNASRYSGVFDSLFEPHSPFTLQDLQNSIENVLVLYEPRIQLLEVNVFDELDNNGYNVQIVFRVVNNKEPTEITLFLERLR